MNKIREEAYINPFVTLIILSMFGYNVTEITGSECNID